MASSIKCFTAAFLQYSIANVNNYLLGGGLPTCYQIKAYQEFFSNLITSEGPKS